MISFTTDGGVSVPTVSVREMREIDRIAVDNEAPNLAQMMENAGRSLAIAASEFLGEGWVDVPIAVFVGPGNNGGGGTAAARHLANRGGDVTVIRTRDPEPGTLLEWQLRIYAETTGRVARAPGEPAGLILDALIGYGLRDEPRGTIAEMIAAIDEADGPVISLDVPSGRDADTGEAPGAAVTPTQTLTLALAKPGLAAAESGDLWLADLGIPVGIFRRAGVETPPQLFERGPIVHLNRTLS